MVLHPKQLVKTKWATSRTEILQQLLGLLMTQSIIQTERKKQAAFLLLLFRRALYSISKECVCSFVCGMFSKHFDLV